MEWASQLFDTISQSDLWQTTLSHFQWIDWLAVIFCIIGFFYGMKRGFMSMFGEVIQLLIVATLTLEFKGKASELIAKNTNAIPEDTLELLSFIAAALVFWLVISFLGKHIGKFISTQTSAFLKIVGGAAGGAFYFFLFLSFISQVIVLSPWQPLKKVYEKDGSYTGVILAELTPNIHRLVTRPLEFMRSPSTQTEPLAGSDVSAVNPAAKIEQKTEKVMTG